MHGSMSKYIAESGFDPPTSGLWAQHAATLLADNQLSNLAISPTGTTTNWEESQAQTKLKI